MSVKTIKKRISLGATAGLIAGLLSVVFAPMASASVGAATYDIRSTGVVTAPQTTTLTSTTNTATMVVGGNLILDIATQSQTLTVTGGTILSVGSDPALGTAVSVGPNRNYVQSGTGGSPLTDVVFAPTAAGTNMVINLYDGGTIGTIASTATITLTVTVIPSGVAGVFSLANSEISLGSDTNTLDGSAATSSDLIGGDVVKFGEEGVINIQLDDGLGSSMPAATTTLAAQVTKGDCYVASALDSGSAPFVSLTAPDDSVVVSSNASPQTCTVAIIVNGTQATTKSIKFLGDVASVKVTYLESARSSTTGNQAAKGTFAAFDANGDKIGNVTIAVDTTKYGNVVSALTLAASTTSTNDASINLGARAGSSDRAFGITCTGNRGTQTGMLLSYTKANGTKVNSDPFNVSCHGGLFSYTASLDAASYKPGGIAKLTISAKDSAGNPVSDGTTLDNGQARVTNTTVTCGGQATAVTAVAASDAFYGGTKSYTFTLGTTEGSYNCVVSLAEYSAAGTGNANLAAVTVPWVLSSGVATVTNAEVLASLVKLIASINKQIRLLQRQLNR